MENHDLGPKPEYSPSMKQRDILEAAILEREWALKWIEAKNRENMEEYVKNVLEQVRTYMKESK